MSSDAPSNLTQSVEALLEFFKGDDAKVMYWLTTPNPMFGGTAPSDLIKAGRGHKVYKFIETALEENEPCEPQKK